MAFKIKDGVRIGIVDVFNNDGTLLVNAPTVTNGVYTNGSYADPSFITSLAKAKVGLGSVDNTSDAAKPVSTAQQTALNLKANLASPAFTGTVTGITKAMVGLSAVDNTSDAAKPVSTAQQTALNLKANLASPAFTGTVTGITKAMVGLSAVENTALSTWAGSSNLITIGNATAASLTITGNLVVNGTTSTVNSTTVSLADPVITLGGTVAPTVNDGKDRGVEFRWHNGTVAKIGFFGYDASTSKLTFIPDATNTSEVFSGTKGTIDATIEWVDVLNKPTIGTVTGVTATAPIASSGGTAPVISISAATTSAAGSMSAADKTKLDGIAAGAQVNTVTSVAGRTGAVVLAKADVGLGSVDNTADSAKSVASAAILTTARTIGGVSFNGSANINLPGVNAVGNQNTTGSAATLTTGRTIALTGDVSYTSGAFNGSANVTGTATLATVNANVGTFNNVTVNAKGLVTAASNVSYLTALTDTLATVTGRGATTGTAIALTNATNATSATTGALVITGGLAVNANIYAKGSYLNANSAGTILNARDVISATVAVTTATAVDSWAAATYRSAKYLVQITQGTNYQFSEIVVVHNGTTTTMTEYAVVETNGALGTFTSDISGGNARLLVTMASATSATISIDRIAMSV
jgi:hypothetical protein